MPQPMFIQASIKNAAEPFHAAMPDTTSTVDATPRPPLAQQFSASPSTIGAVPPILRRWFEAETHGAVSSSNGTPFRRRRTDQSGSALQRGVTLIELAFTMAIVATLCAISMPSFSAIIASNRARAANNTLVNALNFARSTAVTRGSEIAICPSSNNSTCDTSIWWQHGWIVFQDLDRNGRRDSSEPILTTAQAQPAIAIATSSGREHVTYRPDGSATGTNLTFTLCDRRGPKHASTVVVNNPGRPRSGPATAAEAAAACAGL